MMQLEITSAAATTANLSFTGRVGAVAEIQIAIRPDFAWGAFPVFPAASGTTMDLAGLNAATSYYARARNVVAGVREDWGDIKSFRTAAGAGWPEETSNIRVDKALIVKPVPILHLDASLPLSGYPVENLAIPDPVAWRNAAVTAPGEKHALLARVGVTPVDTFALLQTNLPEDTTLSLAAYTTVANVNSGTADWQATFPNARASQGLPGRPGYHFLIRLSEPRTYPFWRLGITAETPGGILHAEHFVLGLDIGVKAAAIDQKISAVDIGSLERSRSGIADRQTGAKLRREEFELAMLTEREFEEHMSPLWRQTNEPMLVAPNGKTGPYLHDRLLYGDFVGGSASRVSSIRYSRPFIIESLI